MQKIESGYAQSGDVTIAYQLGGSGVPLVWVPGFISHVELNWESPLYGHGLARAVQFSRLATFDKRGTGLSDRTVAFGALEHRVDDIRAVMDAVGFERCNLCGFSEGGPLSLMFAAMYPERVEKLVLYGTFARLAWAEDYPFGVRREDSIKYVEWIRENWGNGQVLSSLSQHPPDRESEIAMMSRLERLTATPEVVASIMRQNFLIDVRPILPLVSSPAIVVHCKNDPNLPFEHGKYLAEHLPSCEEFVELDGDFHVSWLPEHHDLILDPIERFVAGKVLTAPVPSERILTTVLFSDIVGSTELAERLGDAVWRTKLDAHDQAIQEEVSRFRGRVIKNTGDGVFACFDGPARAAKCGLELVKRLSSLGLSTRIGVHTGECEERGDDLSGIAVHLAARVMSLASPGQVLATRTLRDLVEGSGLVFADHGQHSFKGLSGEFAVYSVSV